MAEVRLFQPEDLDALYEISLATGLAGGDAAHLYEDKRLIGHIYSAPYALLDPGLALVAVDTEGVGGFVVGTHDTKAWEDRLDRDWWPVLRASYDPPAGDDASAMSPEQQRIYRIFHPERTPVQVAESYPAHLHMNLLPRLQNQGVGLRLLDNWLQAARKRDVEAVHVAVNRANTRGIRFWSKHTFVEIPAGEPAGRKVWMGRKEIGSADAVDSN